MDNAIVLAGCIILDDYDRILLLHRNTDRYQHWELPGGKVEQEEMPAEAAVRELHEELGVAVELIQNVGNDTFEDGGENYQFHWFLARVKAGTPQVMESDKFDDLDYMDIEDFPSLSLSANMQLLHEKLLSGEVVLTR